MHRVVGLTLLCIIASTALGRAELVTLHPEQAKGQYVSVASEKVTIVSQKLHTIAIRTCRRAYSLEKPLEFVVLVENKGKKPFGFSPSSIRATMGDNNLTVYSYRLKQEKKKEREAFNMLLSPLKYMARSYSDKQEGYPIGRMTGTESSSTKTGAYPEYRFDPSEFEDEEAGDQPTPEAKQLCQAVNKKMKELRRVYLRKKVIPPGAWSGGTVDIKPVQESDQLITITVKTPEESHEFKFRPVALE